MPDTTPSPVPNQSDADSLYHPDHIAKHTPMMQQYLTLKSEHRESLLLYRMGDFYELFFDDAKRAADILGLTLTRRGQDKSGVTIPMAGVPFHAADSYMARLVAAGETVVVCEQMEDASNAKGLMRREVVRTLTAGTLVDESLITSNHTPNVLAISLAGQRLKPKRQPPVSTPNLTEHSLAEDTDTADSETAKDTNTDSSAPSIDWSTVQIGLARLDIAAGTITTQQIAATDLALSLAYFHPSECLVSEDLPEVIFARLQRLLACPLHCRPSVDFALDNAAHTLRTHFSVTTLDGYGMTHLLQAQSACAAVLHYARQAQQNALSHVNQLTLEHHQDYLLVDQTSQINLEIFATISDRGMSLLDVVNQCQTAMGRRLLIEHLRRPLTDLESTQQRYDAIDCLLAATGTADIDNLRHSLGEIADIERISSRISLGRAKPTDLVQLKHACYLTSDLAGQLRQLLSNSDSEASSILVKLLEVMPPNQPQIERLSTLIDNAIVAEPPTHLRDGGVILPHYDSELDVLQDQYVNVQQHLDDLLSQEKQQHDLATLKVGFNKVSGFYFELSRAQSSQAPEHFVRRQTLKNSERFITDALKTIEDQYLSSQSKAIALEKELYRQLLVQLAEYVPAIQKLASAIAQLDVVINWGYLACQHHWVRPQRYLDQRLDIIAGRHPVVEAAQSSNFTPNDCQLNTSTQPCTLMLITGPNMGGKSTYMRQVALIVLLASCGSYVPATEAHIGKFGRIFTRIGSSDDVSAGHSTFMVEMVQTAQIINQAQSDALVLMDEVGRGTSTLDGLAIAHACVDQLANQMHCTTLFATHYFELTELADTNPRIINTHVAAAEIDGQLLLLHQIRSGAANSSFGLHVAKIAGLPDTVLTAAHAYLTQLQQRNETVQLPTISDESTSPPDTSVLQQQLDHAQIVTDAVNTLDPDSLSPREALDKLYQLKQLLNKA